VPSAHRAADTEVFHAGVARARQTQPRPAAAAAAAARGGVQLDHPATGSLGLEDKTLRQVCFGAIVYLDGKPASLL